MNASPDRRSNRAPERARGGRRPDRPAAHLGRPAGPAGHGARRLRRPARRRQADRDLGEHHDPDWWIKKLVERENIAVLPPSVQLRKEDAELDDRLDEIFREAEVREIVEDFNKRVIAARYGAPVGPPLVTMPRDVDATVHAWTKRREERRVRARAAATADPVQEPPRRRRWWQRSR